MILQGLGVVPGLANGQAWRFRVAPAGDVLPESVEHGSDPDREAARSLAACRQAARELRALQIQVSNRLGADKADIFGVQLLILDDPHFIDTVCHLLRETCVQATAAVQQAAEILAARFLYSSDSNMQAHVHDIRDVSWRLVRILSHHEAGQGKPEGKAVILADELLPSQIMDLYQIPVAGLILKYGSPVSHAVILARSLGTPMIIGLGEDMERIHEHEPLWLNGSAGTIFSYPPDAQPKLRTDGPERGNRLGYAAAEQTSARPEEVGVNRPDPVHATVARRYGAGPDSHSRGQIRICVNLNRLEDITPMVRQKAEGVGLFRSEFLCLGRSTWPTEDRQVEIYRQILAEFPEQMVAIRTFDLGNDKTMDLLNIPLEANPALGYRGIRVCLDRPDIFTVQLRALLRAGQTGHLCILLPMITTLAEVRQVKTLLSGLKQDLVAEGLAIDHNPLLGVMIETPAAALISEQLAVEVDYFSIGTNDLIQYTLAVDRSSAPIRDLYTAHHPAVLTLIRQVVEQAHQHGLAVGLCGEAAVDPDLFPWFCAIGLDELSVSPDRLPEMRERVHILQKNNRHQQEEQS